MSKNHHYSVQVEWSADRSGPTTSYTSYNRNHLISASGKETIEASADPAFRGDNDKYNPEDWLVASISSCHMLWYLHLCADKGISVTHYTDNASGIMIQHDDGSGEFVSITLKPIIHITEMTRHDEAVHLHELAHQKCFISRSVKFPIIIQPLILAHL